jgi:protein-tyrosine-phosphatase
MSFTTGDVDIKLKSVSITSEKVVTVDDIINEAIAINKKLRAKKIKPGDFDASDAFMSAMRKEHKEFSQSYPIVLRYMCQMQQFHSNALRKYLNYIRDHPWKNQNEYLESQVNYVVILYKETHKRWNRTEVDNLAKNVHKMLKQEHERFIELSDKYKKEVEHEETGYKASREESMKAFYALQGHDTLDLHLRTATDIPTGETVNVDIAINEIDVENPPVVTSDDLLE